MRTNWTVDPETGRTNSSPAFVALRAEIARLIRSEAHALIHGQTETVAGLILAQLAHVHGFWPVGEVDAAMERATRSLELFRGPDPYNPDVAFTVLEAALCATEGKDDA